MLVRVLIADDHPIVRKGMRSVLENEPWIKVVGEAEDGTRALEAVENLRPDVLIVDMMMPGHNGLEVIRQAKQFFPALHVLVLSMHKNEAYVAEALNRGASGYILKDTGPTELVEGVKIVISGERYLSKELTEQMGDSHNYGSDDFRMDSYETLTNREREILQLAAEGHTSLEIAQRLSISRRTVETHRANLMDKLNLRNQTDLVLYAIKRGILLVEE
jgi:two-component system response regulator NreC